MERVARRRLALRIGLYALVAIAACLVPIWWASRRSSWVGATYGIETLRFELFGFLAAAALVLVAVAELRRRNALRGPWREAAVVLLPLAVGLHFVTSISESTRKMWDYQVYEAAALQLRYGHNPYDPAPPYLFGRPRQYLYPPLTAQAFAKAYDAVATAPRVSGWGAALERIRTTRDAETVFDQVFPVFDSVFYYYRCAQLLLVLLAYYLCYVFARRLRIPPLWVHALVAGLLLLNNPLFRTLRWNQVNLWLLDLGLIGILAARYWGPVAGFAIALAGHIKLYPLTLLAALVGARQWRAATWTLLSLVLILFLQTDFFRDWTVWQQFFVFFRDFSWNVELSFRNNSVYSLTHNSLRLLAGVDPAQHAAAIRASSSALSLAAAVWLVRRFAVRETTWRRGGEREALAGIRLLGHGADALALGLLVSPSVWEHHYVLAMPLIIWVVALRGRDRPWAVGSAALLVLALPTFDVFPVSYHRIVGLVMLLVLADPRRLRPCFGGSTRPAVSG